MKNQQNKKNEQKNEKMSQMKKAGNNILQSNSRISKMPILVKETNQGVSIFYKPYLERLMVS